MLLEFTPMPSPFLPILRTPRSEAGRSIGINDEFSSRLLDLDVMLAEMKSKGYLFVGWINKNEIIRGPRFGLSGKFKYL